MANAIWGSTAGYVARTPQLARNFTRGHACDVPLHPFLLDACLPLLAVTLHYNCGAVYVGLYISAFALVSVLAGCLLKDDEDASVTNYMVYNMR